MKYINFKRYKFSTIFKFIDLRRYKFRKVSKYLDISQYNFNRAGKFPILKKYKLSSIIKNITNISFKKINLISNRFVYLHLPVAIVFFGFLYLAIPTFYIYDKPKIENFICKNKNIKCSIKGKIKYNFYPTPRIKIKDLIIDDISTKEKSLMTVNEVIIKLSFKNLLVKEKHKFKKLELNKFTINLNFKNLKKYQNIFLDKNDSVPINLTKGKIILNDENNYVAMIDNIKSNIFFNKKLIKAKLKGNFLGDKIYISIDKKKEEARVLTDIVLKMKKLNLLTKVNLFISEKNDNIVSGNLLIKKNQNKFTAIFDYKNNEFIINKSNLRNSTIDGKLEGTIKLLPYFNFDLDVNLNSINFTKLTNYFLNMDKKSKGKLFNINNKINGKINLSANKVYSGYNLIKSFESRIKFNNNNILIEQFLVNLGKLGAADFLGSINNDKKFTNFKFESNIFVDNEKKFLSKFGIYKKKSIFPSLFVSGNFDLTNPRMSFYEITDNEKLKADDINFIEKEFNYFMLENGYKSLFHFPNFKNFVSSITSEPN